MTAPRTYSVGAALLGLALASSCTLHNAPTRHGHPAFGATLGTPALHAGAAAKPAARDRPVIDDAQTNRARLALAAAAAAVVGKRSVKAHRADCSGTARGIYAQAGYPIDATLARADIADNDVRRLYALVGAVGSLRKTNPRPGDFVFFDNTYDQNRDGLRNDLLSHVGVVERVLDDGTVVFVHRVGAGILRYRMNLDHPSTRRHPTTRAAMNHYLRRQDGGVPARTTAELFTGFGTLLTGATEGWVDSPRREPLTAQR